MSPKEICFDSVHPPLKRHLGTPATPFESSAEAYGNFRKKLLLRSLTNFSKASARRYFFAMYFIYFSCKQINCCCGFDRRSVSPRLTRSIYDRNKHNQLWRAQTLPVRRRGGGPGEFSAARSSALCHPADICYICMAAGDPRIKRLQEYCHISFNNVIILEGMRCFIPGASQSFLPLSPCVSTPSVASAMLAPSRR